jgi:hypothetical protein
VIADDFASSVYPLLAKSRISYVPAVGGIASEHEPEAFAVVPAVWVQLDV